MLDDLGVEGELWGAWLLCRMTARSGDADALRAGSARAAHRREGDEGTLLDTVHRWIGALTLPPPSSADELEACARTFETLDNLQLALPAWLDASVMRARAGDAESTARRHAAELQAAMGMVWVPLSGADDRRWDSVATGEQGGSPR
jgi:hypothetical protein